MARAPAVDALRRIVNTPREHSLYAVLGRTAASLLIPRLTRDARRIVTTRGVRLQIDLRTPLGLGLYRYGMADPLVAFLAGLVGPGDVAIDGGANIGLVTTALARAVEPGGRVIAFEPAPGTCALLRRNIDLNGMTHVDVQAAALLDQTGDVEFDDATAGSGTAAVLLDGATAAAIRVQAVRLDDLIDVGRIRLIKLDLEGAELHALRGASALIERYRPLLVVEVEPSNLARFGTEVADLEAFARDHGYRACALLNVAGCLRPKLLDAGWQRSEGANENVILVADD